MAAQYLCSGVRQTWLPSSGRHSHMVGNEKPLSLESRTGTQNSVSYMQSESRSGEERRQSNKACFRSVWTNKEESNIDTMEAIYTDKCTLSFHFSVLPLLSHLCAERLTSVVTGGHLRVKALLYMQHRNSEEEETGLDNLKKHSSRKLWPNILSE